MVRRMTKLLLQFIVFVVVIDLHVARPYLTQAPRTIHHPLQSTMNNLTFDMSSAALAPMHIQKINAKNTNEKDAYDERSYKVRINNSQRHVYKTDHIYYR